MDTETESLRTEVKRLTERRQKGTLESEKIRKQLLHLSIPSNMRSPRELKGLKGRRTAAKEQTRALALFRGFNSILRRWKKLFFSSML